MIRPGWLPIAALVIASVSGIGPARAGDIQVNTYTTGNQGRPSIAMEADGDFVVVWHSAGSTDTDSDGFSIQGQRYASGGSPESGEFQVNTYTPNAQVYPTVAMDADGDFVVVWHGMGSTGTDLSANSIHAQRFDSNGSPAGDEFQVNTYTSSNQIWPAVAMDADGDFVVVWSSDGSGGTDSWWFSVQGQRYSSDGSPVGDEFQINTYTSREQLMPAVALDEDGNFSVVWVGEGSDAGTDSSFFSIQGQRYGSDGFPVAGEFQVNTYTTSGQISPSRADGNAVVVWMSRGSGGTDSDGYSIQGQRYAADGNPVAGEFQINTDTSGDQFYPAVALDADGEFVVIWHDLGSGPSFYRVQGQRYAVGGAPVATEFQVNTYTTAQPRPPSVSVDGSGDFVVVWQSSGSSGTDSSGDSVQRTPVARIFADGFVSGDTTAWDQESRSRHSG